MTRGRAETDHGRRIRELADRLDDYRDGFETPDDPPDEEFALELLRRGFGPTVSLYVELRTGGRMASFTPDEFSTLEDTMNGWLDLYVACYGVDAGHDFTVREAAKLLVETRNVRDTARVLTRVPSE